MGHASSLKVTTVFKHGNKEYLPMMQSQMLSELLYKFRCFLHKNKD
jgi:hypothetical protein